MEFEVGDVLTLEDNKDYVVSQNKLVEGFYYMLLIELPDYKSFKFVKVIDNDNLEEIDDIDKVEELSAIFQKREA